MSAGGVFLELFGASAFAAVTYGLISGDGAVFGLGLLVGVLVGLLDRIDHANAQKPPTR